MVDLSAPCFSCDGSRKRCTMNCGRSAGDVRSRKQCLEQCDDCTTCFCRWNNVGKMKGAIVKASEDLPPGFRLIIEVEPQTYASVRVECYRASYSVNSQGSLAGNVLNAVEWAKMHHAARLKAAAKPRKVKP